MERAPTTPGVLYVVATPIGNLEDVTLRALRILGEVAVIAAEDTRRTRILLQRHGIRRPLVSYHDAVERERTPALVARLVRGDSIALVSDAGTPGVADPGYHLVRGALAAGIPVVPVPGPSAVTALISVAGLAIERFVFEGFLPAKVGARQTRLRALAGEQRALVLLESGRRVGALLAACIEVFGANRAAVMARELTKLHEEIRRGTLGELLAGVGPAGAVRGEVTLAIARADGAEGVEQLDLDEEIGVALKQGERPRSLAQALAARTQRPWRDIYRRVLVLARKAGA